MLALMGAIHLTVNNFLKKKLLSSFFSVLLLIFLATIFKPFVSLMPNLSVDSFFEATNFEIKEAVFYIKTFGYSMYSKNSLILWAAIYSSYFIFILLFQKLLLKFYWKKQVVEKLITYIIVCLLVFPISFATYTSIIGYQKSSIVQSKVTGNFDSDLSQLSIQNKYDIPLNIIAYIGESTSRLHWSLYGYPRPTTKSLDKYEGKGELIKFENIYSSHSHTSPSLLEALSIDADFVDNLHNIQPIENKRRVSLVDVLIKGGIKTHLYSNQGSSGTWNMASSIIFKNAILKKFSSTKILGNAADIDKNKPYDHVFLDDFLLYLKDTPKVQKNFVVFHSYAGHGPYERNIPINYREIIDDYYEGITDSGIFGEAKNIATLENLESYDSVMRYISDNLTKVLNVVDTINKPTVLVYFSDHGESVFSGKGHDSSRYTWEMTAVPFLLYFNESAKMILKDKYEEYKILARDESADS